jgi:hypothetical protein
MIVTKDMHERKRSCSSTPMRSWHSRAASALWKTGRADDLVQLGRHNKPILLANIDGFWDPCSALIDHMKRTEFIAPICGWIF